MEATRLVASYQTFYKLGVIIDTTVTTHYKQFLKNHCIIINITLGVMKGRNIFKVWPLERLLVLNLEDSK